MYKVLPDGGGWSVFWIESPDTEPRLVPHVNGTGQVVPYTHRQAAYRRCKKLNDAVKQLEKMEQSSCSTRADARARQSPERIGRKDEDKMDIHGCIRLSGTKLSPLEIQLISNIHQSKGCPPREILWLNKEENGFSFIHDPYPDEMDREDAQSLQEVCKQVWGE